MTTERNKMTRVEAAWSGATKYIGKPCKNCGCTVRYFLSKSCVDCAAKASRMQNDQKYGQRLKDAA